MSVYDTYIRERKTTAGSGLYQQFLDERKPKVGLVERIASVRKPIEYLAGKIQQTFSEKKKTELSVAKPIATEVWKAWSSSIEDSSRRINSMMDSYTKPGKKDFLGTYIKTAEAGLGFANVFFSPVTGVMKGLEAHPVFGWPAAAVNGIFFGVGEGSSELALKALDRSPFSNETKQKLAPIVSELSALAGQIVLGKGGEVAVSKFKANTKAILDTVKSEPQTLYAQPTPKTISTSAERYQKYLKEQGYEPYTPDNQLPTIELGGKTKSGLPTIQIGAPKDKPVRGDFVYEPVKEAPVYTRFTEETGRPQGNGVGVQSPETFYPRAALKLRAEAETRGIQLESIAPEERQRNVQQWKDADTLVAENPEQALKIWRGEEAPPEGILRNAVEGSLERLALKNGDTSLLNELIRSKVATETARELQTRNRDFDTTSNPVDAARAVRAARMGKDPEAVGKSEQMVKKEKASVEKIKAPDMKSWSEFIKSLKC